MDDPVGPLFDFADDPAAPGWKVWRIKDRGRFNAFVDPLHVRIENSVARVRMIPRREQSNLHDIIHGGLLLGFMDVALYAAGHGFGIYRASDGMTIDLSAQFIAGARLDRPLDAKVELLRETGRMVFMRGLLEQEGEPAVASFTGTIRKPSPPRA